MALPRLAALLLVLCATTALAKAVRYPIVDYGKLAACNTGVDNGWDPVCVAGGPGFDKEEGLLYPNICAATSAAKPVAFSPSGAQPNASDEGQVYTYLPLRCGSRVACSLVARSVEACKKAWARAAKKNGGGSGPPPSDAECECGMDFWKPCAAPGKGIWAGCLACSAENACKKCKRGFQLDFTGRYCEKIGRCKVGADACRKCDAKKRNCEACQPGWRVSAAGICHKCAGECRFCPDARWKCAVCKKGYRLDKGACKK